MLCYFFALSADWDLIDTFTLNYFTVQGIKGGLKKTMNGP